MALSLRTRLVIALSCAVVFAGGCALAVHGQGVAAPVAETGARGLAMFAGAGGDALDWPGLMDEVKRARVIVVGEKHDDAAGHAFELALVKAVLDRWPGSCVSMEMFERDEQELVDAYLSGGIKASTLYALTDSERWGGKDGWTEWYLPVVDAARERGAAVIAANAPSAYTGLARMEGLDALGLIGRPARGYFKRPGAVVEDDYHKRFMKIMKWHTEAPAAKDGDTASHAHFHHALSDDAIESFFDAQRVWDATMADSIVKASRTHRKVVHLVGQFHSDFDGGVVVRLRKSAPWLKVLTISLQPTGSSVLREEDRGRADVVVYTGGTGGPGEVINHKGTKTQR